MTKAHKSMQMLNLLQIDQQSTYVGLNKPHAHLAMTQMSVKAGINKFGDKGNEALLKEQRQLHDRKAMLPKRKDKLSQDNRKRALRYLMFIKEKRDGTIKAGDVLTADCSMIIHRGRTQACLQCH